VRQDEKGMAGRIIRMIRNNRRGKNFVSPISLYTIQKTMAQLAIREYDAKRMFAEFSSSVYRGYLIQDQDDIDAFAAKEAGAHITWVIKPDQLFGKRGKYGLIGVNLDVASIRKWWNEHNQQRTTIGKQDGKLTTFLIEPFVPHAEEYYVAIKTERDNDVIYFSTAGGIEVEENWETVQEMQVPLSICHPGGMVARDLDSRETDSGFLHTQE
jgi:succinyl-CoA synthetase beta subunit